MLLLPVLSSERSTAEPPQPAPAELILPVHHSGPGRCAIPSGRAEREEICALGPCPQKPRCLAWLQLSHRCALALACVSAPVLQAVCDRECRRGNGCGARGGGRAHLGFGERPPVGVFERLPRGNPRPTARSRPTPAQGALGDGHSGRAFDFGPRKTLTGILPRTQALVYLDFDLMLKLTKL